MPGMPKRRERKRAGMAAEQGQDVPPMTPKNALGADEIPDALPVGAPRTRTRSTARTPPQTHTRTRTHVREPAAGFPPGPSTRATADSLQAQQLANFAAALEPGISLGIERTRPGWCAGFLENYLLEDGGLPELREYLQAEYGGQTYKVTVQHSDGRPYYPAKLNIAGRPREFGRLIDRATWEGSEPLPARQPAAAAPPADSGIMGKLLDITVDNNKQVLATVERMGKENTEQTRNLIETIVQGREETEKRKGLVGSLKEFVQASEAIEEVKDIFGKGDNAEPAADDNQNLVNEATRDFFRAVVQRKAADWVAPKPAADQAQDRRPPKNRRSNGKKRGNKTVVDAQPARVRTSGHGAGGDR